MHVCSGTVDECNAVVGLASSHLVTGGPSLPDGAADYEKLVSRLRTVQHHLFDLGAHLATPRSTSSQSKIEKTQFPTDAATELEAWIDDMDEVLPPLTTFVLPGGHPAAAALHLARTVARRAERAVTPLFLGETQEIDEGAYRYVNRLSDFFFVASRFANKITGETDVTWEKSVSSS